MKVIGHRFLPPGFLPVIPKMSDGRIPGRFICLLAWFLAIPLPKLVSHPGMTRFSDPCVLDESRHIE
jgi:hypothetical protein